MKNKIEIGDDVYAGINKSRARVVGITTGKDQYTVKYYTGEVIAKGSRQYHYEYVELITPKPEQLYTLYGGKEAFKKLAEFGEYAWVTSTSDMDAPPLSVRLSAIREIPRYKYLTCSVVGLTASVHKKALSSLSIQKGDSFVTPCGAVLTVKGVSNQVPDYFKKMDPNKIPTLEGQQIKFL